MFTGIVEELGALAERDARAEATRFRFEATRVRDGLAIGDSVAVNGCCLTVVEIDGRGWSADVVPETLSRTNLGELAVGEAVNLERSLAASDRLGGHLVQGHVDAVGVVRRAAPDLAITCPAELLAYIVEKGSITVDGVSLTVVEPLEGGFRVALIPHTMAVTTLGRRRVGARVNLEVDVVAKYVERLLQAGAVSPYRPDAAGTGRGGGLR